MLGTLAKRRIDWGGAIYLAPAAILVAIAGSAVDSVTKANDPGYAARMVQQCIPSATRAVISVHFSCVGDTFDKALSAYLDEHANLEVAGIASFEHQTDFGSSGTKGYTVAFREKQKP
jgi:hypothetical protein